MKTRRMFVLLLAGLLLVGCEEDGVITDPPAGPEGYPEPLVAAGVAGLDQLAANLELAWQKMNYAEYEKLIAEDYQFRVDPAEIDIVGHTTLNAVQDLSATQAIFSGETGLEPIINPNTGLPTGDWRTVPAVQTIQIDLIPDSSSDWEQMTSGDRAGTWRRIYDVDMAVTHQGDQYIAQIRGKQILFAAENPESGLWQLHTWEDQGIPTRPGLAGQSARARADNSDSFGSLKARFLRQG